MAVFWQSTSLTSVISASESVILVSFTDLAEAVTWLFHSIEFSSTDWVIVDFVIRKMLSWVTVKNFLEAGNDSSGLRSSENVSYDAIRSFVGRLYGQSIDFRLSVGWPWGQLSKDRCRVRILVFYRFRLSGISNWTFSGAFSRFTVCLLVLLSVQRPPWLAKFCWLESLLVKRGRWADLGFRRDHWGIKLRDAILIFVCFRFNVCLDLRGFVDECLARQTLTLGRLRRSSCHFGLMSCCWFNVHVIWRGFLE